MTGASAHLDERTAPWTNAEPVHSSFRSIPRGITGYRGKQLEKVIASDVTLEDFFEEAPRLHPNASLITGVVCGVRVEELEDPLMQKIRYLDKLIDELAKGKKMPSILRGSDEAT